MSDGTHELLRHRDLVFELSGLWFNTNNLPLFQNKVLERVRAVKATDINEYFDRFVRDEDNRHELEQLIN